MHEHELLLLVHLPRETESRVCLTTEAVGISNFTDAMSLDGDETIRCSFLLLLLLLLLSIRSLLSCCFLKERRRK